mgnify:CR=1 FL=1
MSHNINQEFLEAIYNKCDPEDVENIKNFLAGTDDMSKFKQEVYRYVVNRLESEWVPEFINTIMSRISGHMNMPTTTSVGAAPVLQQRLFLPTF